MHGSILRDCLRGQAWRVDQQLATVSALALAGRLECIVHPAAAATLARAVRPQAIYRVRVIDGPIKLRHAFADQMPGSIFERLLAVAGTAQLSQRLSM